MPENNAAVKRPPIRRIAAAVVALSVGLLTAVVAVPMSASAHTGTLNASAVCSADGSSITITYSGVTQSVPTSGAGHTATLTVGEILPSGSTVTPSTQTVVGNTSYSFTQTVASTATSAQATAFLTWGDNATSDPQGKIDLTGVCKTTPPPAVKDATASASTTPATCAAPGKVQFAIENATWDDANDITDGSRTATAVSGHVFSDGKSTATVTYTIPPVLNPNAAPCATADATASATATPATCTAPGSANFTISNATWNDAADLTDGSRDATALPGHLFANGTTAETVTYTPEAQLSPNAPQCLPKVTPSSTNTEQLQCASTDALITTTTTTPTYTLQGTTWVRGADQVSTATSTRPLTATEAQSCPTTVVSPPTPADKCANIDGIQTKVPSGDTKNAAGDCVAITKIDAPTSGTTDSTTTLASTGFSDDLPIVGLFALLAMLIGGGLIVTRRMAARRETD